MRIPILLVSPDAALAGRVRRALPMPAKGDLVLAVAPGWAAAVTGPNEAWQLVLVDVQALAAESNPQPMPRRDGPGATPVLWLGQAPLLPSGMPEARVLPGPVLDYLDRNLPISKLAFVLHEHVAAAHWRVLHRRQAGPAPAHVHAEINNTLTAILGNAELAAEQARNPHRRTATPPLQQRLDRIVELAGRMRLLMQYANPPEVEPLRP